MQQAQDSEVAPPPWTLRGDATVIPFRRGVLAFIRYAQSNVGPYEELLWLAPFRQSPGGRAHHVAPIFVSSEASLRGGRANWGLPKELALFRVVSAGSARERVEVTREGQLLAAFTRSCPLGALPLELGKLPARARRIVQLRDGQRFETVPAGRGHFQVTAVSELEVHRELLPGARSSAWRLAFYLSDFELYFPAARVWDAR